jgi:hypothetical protein
VAVVPYTGANGRGSHAAAVGAGLIML